jgi:phospholipase D1/2
MCRNVKLIIWDVFLLDSDFKIERPRRYYRQGLNLLHSAPDKDSVALKGDEKMHVHHEQHNGLASAMGTIRSRMSRIFHIGHHNHDQSTNGNAELSHPRPGSVLSGSSGSSSEPSLEATQMLDPSTNTNPLEHPTDDHGKILRAGEDEKKKKKKRTGDVSKHTFYIENSQMRLKLFARNEVSLSHRTVAENSGLTRFIFSVKCCNGSLHSKRSQKAHTTLVTTGSIASHRSG